MTKTVEDSAFLLNIISGIDPNDNTTLDNKNQDYLSDTRYSEIKTRSLIRRSYGIYYIKKYLQQEKIEEDIINQSIKNCIKEQNIYWPDNIKNYLNKYSYDYLDNSPKYKKKWQNKLYNRGFEQTDINKILFKRE